MSTLDEMEMPAFDVRFDSGTGRKGTGSSGTGRKSHWMTASLNDKERQMVEVSQNRSTFITPTAFCSTVQEPRKNGRFF